MAYEYGAKEPEKLKIKDMTPREKSLLLESDTFCMMPWPPTRFPGWSCLSLLFRPVPISCGRSKQRLHGNCVQWCGHETDEIKYVGKQIQQTVRQML